MNKDKCSYQGLKVPLKLLLQKNWFNRQMISVVARGKPCQAITWFLKFFIRAEKPLELIGTKHKPSAALQDVLQLSTTILKSFIAINSICRPTFFLFQMGT